MKKLILTVFIYLFVFSSYAFDDTTQYTDLLIESKNLSIDKQLKANQDYLEEYPNSLYKTDIINNIKTLEEISEKKVDSQENSKNKDTELFFKARGLAKTLSLKEKISLWEQFVLENPRSIYLKDAQYNLRKLRSRYKQKNPKQEVHISEQISPVARRLPYKDRKKAMTLASTAGIVVPGIGHWYTKDYIPASIATALRVTGVGLYAKGYYDNNRSTQVTGFLISLFSYLADVADAPFSVERYNDAVDEKNSSQSLNFLINQNASNTKNFVLSFKF